MINETSSASILDRSAGFMMGLTSRKLSHLFTQRLKPYDITPEQWMVLYCIHEREGMIQTEIAARSGKDKPTTGRILETLESKGFVTKQIGKTDRRSFVVFITDAGKELLEQTEPIERQTVADATTALSTAEYEQLLLLLRRIGDTIDHMETPDA
ncbi:MarR family winged helix-turn-helix transcriptional regulator [Paenibacillus ginsengarvi]|uniref:MarR family transcriptional regulator n=1 Tax=Paenibacillus ginsengarvi TaxID=400777 RepID=A0A3B0C7E6_9BACL|nr:MarR family transcriptional regulator [Paenibacillus ginsengarvi]RKN82075.1 MarR family transcriptional regulator [Paenibacillus ginsengarvi]